MSLHILYAVEKAVKDMLAADLPAVTFYRGYERPDEQAPAIPMIFPSVTVECSTAEPQSAEWHGADWRAELNVRIRSKIMDAMPETHDTLVESVLTCLPSDFTTENVLTHQSTTWGPQTRQVVFGDVMETTQTLTLLCQAP